jgi:iron(III) transport system substrate-binding protein
MTIRVTTRAAHVAGAFAFLPGLAQAAPQPTLLTPELIEAARKEGKVVYYTAIDIKVAQNLAKAFEQKYPASRCKWSAPSGFDS